LGLILDSSVVIAAEQRGDTVEQLIEKIVKATGDPGSGTLGLRLLSCRSSKDIVCRD